MDVLIDLKRAEIKHNDIGQMNLYLNYFKTEVCQPDDNLHVEDKRVYMPIYMLMFIQKFPAPASQIFKFDLQNL